MSPVTLSHISTLPSPSSRFDSPMMGLCIRSLPFSSKSPSSASLSSSSPLPRSQYSSEEWLDELKYSSGSGSQSSCYQNGQNVSHVAQWNRPPQTVFGFFAAGPGSTSPKLSMAVLLRFRVPLPSVLMIGVLAATSTASDTPCFFPLGVFPVFFPLGGITGCRYVCISA
jgi:hypothetical protein